MSYSFIIFNVFLTFYIQIGDESGKRREVGRKGKGAGGVAEWKSVHKQ